MFASTIKLLPHVLVRLGGISFDVLEKLNYSESLFIELEQYELIEKKFNESKTDLLAYLRTFPTNHKHFKIIRKLKKVVVKNKSVTSAILQPLDESIINKTLIYNNLLKNKITIKTTLNQLLEVETLELQKTLQELSTHKNLQNALPLSSLVFAKQYLKYLNNQPIDFRKKLNQTQQTLIQFLSRSAAKTSPFSSFTPVGYATLSDMNSEKFIDTGNLNLKLNHQLEWNNYLLEIFKIAFQQNIDVFLHLKIQLNSTLKLNDGNYEFLINQHNVESFQTLEQQPILEIFEHILNSNKIIKIQGLINEITEVVEVEQSEIIAFIRELIEIGFMEIQFHFHQKSSIWLTELISFSNEVTILKQYGIPLFQKMQDQITRFKTANITERIKILEYNFNEIKLFFERLTSPTSKFDFQSIISAEQLIYEDTAYQGFMRIDKASCQKLIQQLNDLLFNLNFVIGQERLRMFHFFDNNYKQDENVPILTFYKNYYQNNKNQVEDKAIEAINKEAKLINSWVDLVEALLLKKFSNKEDIKLSIGDFETINQALNIYPNAIKDSSFSCFAQFYEAENTMKAVLNNLSLGFGKMTSRFLDLMPKTFYEDLNKLNQNENEDFIKAEFMDASSFNANIHQALFEYSVSDKQYDKSKISSLQLSDLVVLKGRQQLILWHQGLKKQVRFYDLGIQTPEGHSPLFQLLLNFSPFVPNLYYLEKAIERFRKKITLKNTITPSIYFEDWLLKRKRWKIPNMRKSTSNRNISQLEEFKTRQLWKRKYELLKINYFLINMKSTDNQVIKNNKPIYINFNNLLFQPKRGVTPKKGLEVLEIEEMLPNEKSLVTISNQKFVSEYTLQWYNE